MNKLEEIANRAEGETKKTILELVNSLAGKIRENQGMAQQIEQLKHYNRLLQKKIFGSSSDFALKWYRYNVPGFCSD